MLMLLVAISLARQREGGEATRHERLIRHISVVLAMTAAQVRNCTAELARRDSSLACFY